MIGWWHSRRIPLAWMLLTRQPVRLSVALAGIAFAGILMFMQFGFRDGLFDASVVIHRRLAADVVMISPRSTSSVAMAGFPKRRLVQAMADPAVVSIAPVRWKLLLWRNPQTRGTRSLLALGFEPTDMIFSDSNVAENADSLSQPGRVLFDQLSRPEFGPVATWFRQGRLVESEIGGQRVRVSGLVSIGASFGADGNLMTSIETLRRISPDSPAGSIELGLIRLKPGVDSSLVAQRLANSLPGDVRVLTKKQFIDFEIGYWASGTSIGFIFTFGAVMGFVVGCVIVYQILYTDVSDHLAEYATLMAMGYKLRSLLGVVAREGFFLAVLGYIPSFILGVIFYVVVQRATNLPVGMNGERAALVFVLILMMCMASSALAMRRLVDADPAEIF